MSVRARLRALRGVDQRYRTDRRLFEAMVAEAVSDLPEPFASRMSNVAVVVEDGPAPGVDACDHEGTDHLDLLGLYQGIPLGNRSSGYHLAVPDRITIYRRAILASCRSEAQLRREIRLTVLHEIGHHFGLSDAELP